MSRRRPRIRIGRARWEWNAARNLYEPVLLEKHVVKEIVERLWLEARIKVWVINQPVAGKTPQNVPGIPDLMGWIPSRIVDLQAGKYLIGQWKPALPLFIEVKRPGGARRPAQERFIEEARAGGCCAFFADSWEVVVNELKNFGIDLTGGADRGGLRSGGSATTSAERP